MEIRQATSGDVDAIIRHRVGMFRDMGHTDADLLSRMADAFRPWVIERMERGVYLTWLAVTPEDHAVAGLGLWLMDWPPHVVGRIGSPRANILNVYTDPAYRRQGLARKLMQTALDYCAEHRIEPVILHASPDGRALYESLGFKPTNEMRLYR